MLIQEKGSASTRNHPFSASIPSSAQGYLNKGAIEFPTDGIKPEDKCCLTCIRYVRRCQGTTILEGKCETCRGLRGRVRNCFWLDPSNNIHTYADAQTTKGTRKLDFNAGKAREVRNLPSVLAYESGRYRATAAWIAEGLPRNDLVTDDGFANIDVMLGFVEHRHWRAQVGEMPSQLVRRQAVEVLGDLYNRLMGMVVRGEGLTRDEVMALAAEYAAASDAGTQVEE